MNEDKRMELMMKGVSAAVWAFLVVIAILVCAIIVVVIAAAYWLLHWIFGW